MHTASAGLSASSSGVPSLLGPGLHPKRLLAPKIQVSV